MTPTSRAAVVICGGPKTGDSSLTGVSPDAVGLCERVSPMAEAVDVAAWLQSAESARPRFENDMRVDAAGKLVGVRGVDRLLGVVWQQPGSPRSRSRSNVATIRHCSVRRPPRSTD